MKIVYYFDRIRLHTEKSKDDFKKIISAKKWKAKKLCNRIEFRESPKSLQKKGVNCRVDFFQARDELIQELKNIDLGEHRFTRIEIAKDIACRDWLYADQKLIYFKNHAVKKRANSKQFLYYAEWEEVEGQKSPPKSYYFGKSKGRESRFYIVAYLPPKTKILNSRVFHTEFVILSKDKVKNILRVSGVRDLKSAKHHYQELSDKHLHFKNLNHTKVGKLLRLSGLDVVRPKGIFDFVEFVKKEQYRINHKIHCKGLTRGRKKRNIMNGKDKGRIPTIYKASLYESKIMGLRLNDYFVSE